MQQDNPSKQKKDKDGNNKTAMSAVNLASFFLFFITVNRLSHKTGLLKMYACVYCAQNAFKKGIRLLIQSD